MNYLNQPWNIEVHTGHTAGGGTRYVICAPDYTNRIAVISLNGAAGGDVQSSADIAYAIHATPDLFQSCKEMLGILIEQYKLTESCDLPENIVTAMTNARIALAKVAGIK
jgi:hypothetical protein